MISHDHRTVFVHVPKTAGQSVETVFLDDLGLSWRDRAPLLLRRNDNQNVGPPRLAHLTAEEYVEHHYLSEELFADYFTFGFVRNPWDRALSMYKYLGVVDQADPMSFHDFVTRRLAGRMWRKRHWWVRPQTEFICDGTDRTVVDFVGRFEHLDRDFARASTRLGLGASQLPRVNISKPGPPGGTASDAGASYAERYDDRSADAIASLYARDIAILGYRFGETAESG